MALLVHRAVRADTLVRGLADLLSHAPPDPFTPEVVAVPSAGVERWISQTLSSRLGLPGPGDSDGVCANVAFPSPARLVSEAVAAVTGVEADEDPWGEARLVWTVLDTVDRCASEPWCRPLSRHLGLGDGEQDRGRRVAVAQKLTRLFTAYAAQRPGMLAAWADRGDREPPDADLVWQVELWRRVRESIGPGLAERLGEVADRLRDDAQVVDLPDRLSVFGPTRLAAVDLAVLSALAVRRDVHLWLPHPSPALWRRVSEAGGSPVDTSGGRGEQPGGEAAAVPSRRADPTATLAVHPLVRSCARDARELQLQLAARGATVDDALTQAPDLEAEPATLLQQLQADVVADRAPTCGSAGADGTVQVHACHGRQRQVEVLREVVLGLLEDVGDPALEPREVVVMCPDIETFAPLLSAVFGPLEDTGDGTVHPGHRLRVRLADRSLRQTNPVLAVVARLLELADARLTAGEVLDLAAAPPVRRRFGLDDDELERVAEWVQESGVRWGLDAQARSPYRLEQIGQNTWQAGLDRVLVGAAIDADDLRMVGTALPLDDVESNDVDLAGRLAELVDRLGRTLRALQREQPLEAWVRVLLEAVDLLTDVAPADAWQVTSARRQLAEPLVTAGDLTARASLSLADVRALLADRLRGRPTRANFRTGHLTLCTMVPMRSVPHRVVCLLGLDDGVFPRSTHRDGDDVLARSPRVGERDARSEDRQLFLDAVMAATQRLVVLYSGADERTGARRPPAVPVGELVDVLHEMGADGVVVHHPLQPFDARNFVPGDLGRPAAFSFDRAGYAGARARLGARAPSRTFLERPLPPPPRARDAEGGPGGVDGSGVELVPLDDLVRFVERPVRALLRQRLELGGLDEEDEPDETIPIELDGLARWAVGDRLLSAGLAGVSRDRAVLAERHRGRLPPGPLGLSMVGETVGVVETLLDRTAGLRSGAAGSVDVDVVLDLGGVDGSVRVAGTLAGVHENRLVRVLYSRLKARQRLRAWVQLLALRTARPDGDWAAATVGRGGGPSVILSAITPPEWAFARDRLADLVVLRRRGLSEPLPFAAATSCAYADRRRRDDPPPDAVARAAGEWRRQRGDGSSYGDFDDSEHLMVWGPSSIEDLLAVGTVQRDEPFAEEPHRFGQLARQVFDPMLSCEAIHR